jgi:hypothetical protein
MHLEALPRGGEKLVGLAHVQSHLANLTMQLKDMAKAKVVWENVWSNMCCVEGHHRNKCLMLGNYTTMGASNPF